MSDLYWLAGAHIARLEPSFPKSHASQLRETRGVTDPDCDDLLKPAFYPNSERNRNAGKYHQTGYLRSNNLV
jgi:hypothetical protein